MSMSFKEYWNRGGASKLQRRPTSSEVKKSARWIWNKAMKHGRTDNKYVDMSFSEFWDREGIGDRIDQKNQCSFFFRIDKTGMKEDVREIWDDAVEFGEREKSSIQFSKNNAHVNIDEGRSN